MLIHEVSADIIDDTPQLGILASEELVLGDVMIESTLVRVPCTIFSD